MLSVISILNWKINENRHRLRGSVPNSKKQKIDPDSDSGKTDIWLTNIIKCNNMKHAYCQRNQNEFQKLDFLWKGADKVTYIFVSAYVVIMVQAPIMLVKIFFGH